MQGTGTGEEEIPAADLSSPESAARCVLAGAEIRSVDALAGCIPPEIRTGLRNELDREMSDPGEWKYMTQKLAPLKDVRESGAAGRSTS